MNTYSGRDVSRDGGEAPSLIDIAAGLGRMPRFAGQTKIYYTVLAHSLVVTKIVSPQAKIYALLHDAPEAIVMDVPTPWKSAAAKNNEHVLMGRICREHGITWPAPERIWEEVMRADAAALAAEAHLLGHTHAEHYWPSKSWDEIEWKARDETLSQIRRGCVWGLDPQLAGMEYIDEFNRTVRQANRDTISPVHNP